MKYAMIPVKKDYNNQGEKVIYRVLISFKRKNLLGIYRGTTLIAVDPYFNDPKSGLKYIFKDDGFYRINSHTEDNTLTIKYHKPYSSLKTIEFKAESITDAMNTFLLNYKKERGN